MDSRLLRYFVTVYDCQGISSAAERLHISQPAITRSIHNLEQDLGVELFERKPNGMIPTRYADVLARRVRLMEMEYRHALAEIDSVRGGTQGIIRIGAGPLWYSKILPKLISSFQDEWPGVRIRLIGGVLNTLLPAMEAGKFDIMCASLDFPKRPGLVVEPLMHVKHSIIASANHPEAKKLISVPHDLAQSPWVVLADDDVGSSRIWSYFSSHGCRPPTISVETSEPELIFDMVARGLHLAHVPDLLLRDRGTEGIVKLRIEGPFWETSAGLVYRSGETQLPYVKRFVEAIQELKLE
ncbi:LysR family transcriptional regulator [Pelagibacterium lacus]|uniref:LysR family transcriptional regulator n=1 Tax=Pelagibacterium lacus TaxID=2282655 RepID=A0A369W0L9_9HYPH|nr:LysR family transcriptional regulator [Pelagibacterium lacus]RDE08214.1 LysR family transcriptional regulator [Pelagibacterium lacus]